MTNSYQSMIDLCWALTLTVAVCVCASLIPMDVFAQATGGNGTGTTQGVNGNNANAIELLFCNVVTYMTGATGKAIATVAIIAVGVGALLGKISWGMALIVALGVGLIFGAAGIVNALNGGTTGACTTGTIQNNQ